MGGGRRGPAQRDLVRHPLPAARHEAPEAGRHGGQEIALHLVTGPVPRLVSDTFPAPHAFTTRLGGVSAGPYASLNVGFRKGDPRDNVERNRELVRGATGARELLALTQRVASDVVVDRGGEGDALVTRRPGVALLTYSADCCLVLLAHRDAVASVHASRPGTRGGILRKAVEAMAVPPAEISALVGPSIGVCCYDLYGPVLDDWRTFGPAHLYERRGRTCLDLRGAVAAQLAAAGVRSIEVCDLCTFCRDDWFFSSRRDGDETGRFGGLVWL